MFGFKKPQVNKRSNILKEASLLPEVVLNEYREGRVPRIETGGSLALKKDELCGFFDMAMMTNTKEVVLGRSSYSQGRNSHYSYWAGYGSGKTTRKSQSVIERGMVRDNTKGLLALTTERFIFIVRDEKMGQGINAKIEDVLSVSADEEESKAYVQIGNKSYCFYTAYPEMLAKCFEIIQRAAQNGGLKIVEAEKTYKRGKDGEAVEVPNATQ
jgi:hypothetical protein